jgi:hypothetical protein
MSSFASLPPEQQRVFALKYRMFADRIKVRNVAVSKNRIATGHILQSGVVRAFQSLCGYLRRHEIFRVLFSFAENPDNHDDVLPGKSHQHPEILTTSNTVITMPCLMGFSFGFYICIFNVSPNRQEDLAKIAQEKGPDGVVTEDDIAGIMGKLRR